MAAVLNKSDDGITQTYGHTEEGSDNDIGEPLRPSNRQRALQIVLQLLEDQWILIGLAIVIAIASQVQVDARQQSLKTEAIAYLSVAVIFLIGGCTLDTKILIRNYARWKVHLFVQAEIFLMTSVLVFGLVEAAATDREFLDPDILVGFIFMSSMATTVNSNVVMTKQAHGNQELAVVQTTIGNLLGVFIAPALVVMYTSVDTWYNESLPGSTADWGQVYRQVMMRLGLSLYLPLAAGQVIRRFFHSTCDTIFIHCKLNKIASLALLVMLWQTYDTAFASGVFNSVPVDNILFIVFFSIGLFLLFLAIALFSSLLWLPRKDVVAISYCVPAKGIAVGVPVATAMFEGVSVQSRATILLPIVIYQCLQLAAGSILVTILRRWIDKHEKAEIKQIKEDVEKLESRTKIATVPCDPTYAS